MEIYEIGQIRFKIRDLNFPIWTFPFRALC